MTEYMGITLVPDRPTHEHGCWLQLGYIDTSSWHLEDSIKDWLINSSSANIPNRDISYFYCVPYNRLISTYCHLVLNRFSLALGNK